MQYPREWVEWDMLPDELINTQLAEYEPGGERTSERYRNGAFHFLVAEKIKQRYSPQANQTELL